MEAVMRLRRAGWPADSQLGHIAGSGFLVVLLCCLFLSGLRQEHMKVVLSGTPPEEILHPAEVQPKMTEPGIKADSLLPPCEYLVAFPTAGLGIPRMGADFAKMDSVILNPAVSVPFVPSVTGTVTETEAVPDTVTGVVSEVTGLEQSEPGTESVKQIKVTLHGNGGTLSADVLMLDGYELNVESIEKPVLPGREFTGWYTDAECTIPFAGITAGSESMDLYAGWRDFTGFVFDGEGYITGYSDSAAITVSGIIQLPKESCLGVREGAFAGLEDVACVDEFYIPQNIVYIAESELNRFPDLMFIYVEAGNPNYYSENGVLYYADGTVAAVPSGLSRYLQPQGAPS